MRPLNLARRPFHNESLPNLLFLLAGLLAVALTAQQAILARRLLSAHATALQADVAALESELSGLRREAEVLRGPVPGPEQVAEWRVLKDLVDRRSFSWSRLLARLESVLPPGVRLVSIDPSTGGGRVRVEVIAVARSREDAFEFVRALREKGGFEDVYPTSLSRGNDGDQISCSMTYRPEAPLPPKTPPAEGS
jgi:type IV pilus assembly protein PilN